MNARGLDNPALIGYNKNRKGAAGKRPSPLVTRSNRQLGRPLRLLLVVIYLYNQAQNADDDQAKLQELGRRHRAISSFLEEITIATSSLIGGARPPVVWQR